MDITRLSYSLVSSSILDGTTKMFKKIFDYLGKAVKSNTGISSLSLVVVAIGVMSVITLIVICICMLVEIITNYTITSSLEGYAAIIGSVSTLIASVGIPKAINNYGEHKFRRRNSRNIDINS